MYTKIALGGTFDHFHKGHQALLDRACWLGGRLVIGVTTKRMLGEKVRPEAIESYAERTASVRRYVNNRYSGKKITIVPLYDPYGALKKDRSIQAVVVGTYYNKKVIQDVGSRIAVVHISPVYAEDKKLLSSTRIRLGEIDRNGRVYSLPRKDMRLPDTLRATLQKPLGVQIDSVNKVFLTRHAPLISVGDVATERLIRLGIVPGVAVVDFRVQRVQTHSRLTDLGFAKHKKADYRVPNPAGTITCEMARALFVSLSDAVSGKPRIVFVEGEEDLATLVVLLRAPLGAVVLYGQPPVSNNPAGLIQIVVTQERKNYAKKLLSQFV